MRRSYKNTFGDLNDDISCRLLHSVQWSASRKHNDRYDHQRSRNAERQREAIHLPKTVNVFSQNGHEVSWNQRSGVDWEVKEWEESRKLLRLLWNLELISTECGDLKVIKCEIILTKLQIGEALHECFLTHGLIPPDPSPINSSPKTVKVCAGKCNTGMAPTAIKTLPTA